MNQLESTPPILEIANLKTFFFLEKATIQALRGVNLSLPRKTTLGLIGESGCGKSVLALSILRLIQPPGRIAEGKILLRREPGQDVVDIAALDANGAEMQRIRAREIGIIPQQPATSLNPQYRVGELLAESVRLHEKVGRKTALDRALELLDAVQASEPKQLIREYPHQLSAGARQKVMVALALSGRPSILIADDPGFALDGAAQARILDLLNRLKEEAASSILLITHNLGVVSSMAERTAVMYLGQIAEFGETRELFNRPLHPYTLGMLSSSSGADPWADNRFDPLSGFAPAPTEAVRGCAFASRCPRVMPVCREEQPPFEEVEARHQAACWLYSK